MAYYVRCKDCEELFDIEDILTDDYVIKSIRCVECRKRYERDKKKKQRANQKNKSLPRKKAIPGIHLAAAIKIGRYLIHQAGDICNMCGYNKHLGALKLVCTCVDEDSLPISEAISAFLEQMNHAAWAAVVESYQRCIVMCPTCEYEFEQCDLRVDDIHYEKNNLHPDMPEPQNLS